MATPSRATHSPQAAAHLRLPCHALTYYLSPERIAHLAQGLGWPGRRRVFDPCATLFTTVDQALHGQCSQVAAVSRLAAASGLPLDRDSGAFCRARRELWLPLVQAAAQDAYLTARSMTPRPRRWLMGLMGTQPFSIGRCPGPVGLGLLLTALAWRRSTTR